MKLIVRDISLSILEIDRLKQRDISAVTGTCTRSLD